jgi:isoleucyl-tRNA synthetase
VQTALHEMTRTIATWMAPILCFTAQDVADELGRATGEPFDVHGEVRAEVFLPGKQMNQPNRRWTDEIRPRREAILMPLEKFRAAGHKSLEARVKVTPAAAERPHWQWSIAHLAELCVVSKVELNAADAPGETQIVVDEAPGPTCPRCWRRTGEAAGPSAPDPNLCLRCASVVAALPRQGGNAS